MRYLKIIIKDDLKEKSKTNRFIRVILKLVSFIFPKANPDFDDIIENVRYWFLEFENENKYPNREIGFNCNEKVIMKMPYKKNYGYWTDNNLQYEDFVRLFNAKIISEIEFLKSWDELN